MCGRTPRLPAGELRRPGGLDELVRAPDDDAHPEHEMYREWMKSIGQVDYDPTRFELNEFNSALASHAASTQQQ